MKKKSLPVIGAGVGVLLTLGVGGALASGVVGGEVQPTSDDSVYVAPSETTAATTTDAPARVAEVPAQEPVEQPPTATVDPVTEPAPDTTPAPETIPAPQVNPDGSLPEGWKPPQNPGEPPIAPEVIPEPEAKLPGEPGYVAPPA